MAGHSHWAGIKHKKALIDNKRGKLWSKLCKAIMVAAKMGGGDPDCNLRLRYAIDAAKAVSVPKDNITRAVKKGSGELNDGENFEEVLYEGYGPGGVAVLCEILTDNRNRTAGELRKIFDVGDGKMGSAGCVAYLFDRKGVFQIPRDKAAEEPLMEIALEAGGDDVKAAGDNFEITCDPSAFDGLSKALAAAGIEPAGADISRIPNSTVDIDAETAKKVIKLLETLDDHEDVQSVSANFNIPEDVLSGMEE